MKISNYQIQRLTNSFIAVTTLTLISTLIPLKINAQIIPDNSLGNENSVIIPNQTINELPSDLIEGGAIRGSNLFHSFSEFNINDGQGAYFSNPNGIINILTRVTGGNISQILGKLGVLGNGNFFLINPNGIFFGPNASLDINGAFFGSTADSILFNNYEFSASNPTAPPLLTINTPIGLNFRENAGDITSEANLNLTNDLNLEAQNLNITGEILSQGNLNFKAKNNLNIDNGFIGTETDNAEKGGNINLEASNINIINTQPEKYVFTSTYDVGKGGDINIKTQNLFLKNEGYLQTETYSDGKPGNINIEAEKIDLINQSSINSVVWGGATGNTGDISINTQTLSLKSGSQILNITEGAGNGGVININADSIFADNVYYDVAQNNTIPSAIASEVHENGTGNAGVINITTNSLKLTNGGQVRSSTAGDGDAGEININANSILIDGFDRKGKEGNPSAILAEAIEGAQGNGGIINITTSTLSLTKGGRIAATTEFLSDSGSITINADSITLTGLGSPKRPEEARSSNITVETFKNAKFDNKSEGKGGNLSITTNNLTISNQAKISAATAGDGNGGDINIKINNNLNLNNGSILASTKPESSGKGGSINIEIGNNVNLNNNASIAVNSQGEGDGGNLKLTAFNLNSDNNSTISAATANGEGGNITLQIADTIQLNNQSLITATAGGTGNGGNLDINTQFLIASYGSDITANAFEGNGGNITITASGIFLKDSKITASSELGIDGTVRLNTPAVDPSRGIIEFSQQIIDPSELIAQNVCQRGEESNFSITGKGGLPISPNQLLENDLIEMELMKPNWQEIKPTTSENKQSITPAKGWIRNEQGEVILVNYDPIVNSKLPCKLQ
jgi:filamentous hemagglutinin family protein